MRRINSSHKISFTKELFPKHGIFGFLNCAVHFTVFMLVNTGIDCSERSCTQFASSFYQITWDFNAFKVSLPINRVHSGFIAPRSLPSVIQVESNDNPKYSNDKYRNQNRPEQSHFSILPNCYKEFFRPGSRSGQGHGPNANVVGSWRG